MSVPWPSESSVLWLQGQVLKPSEDYYNLCAHLCALSGGYLYAGADASPWGRAIPRRLRHYGIAPYGAIYCWVTNGYGHIARSVGGGYVLCNNSKGGVSKIHISYYAGLGTPFWVPNVAGAFPLAGGKSPYKMPVPPPKPLLPGVVLANVRKAQKARGHAKGIIRVKEALVAEGIALPNTNDHAGGALSEALKVFQGRNGWKQTGMIDRKLLTLLGSRHGFRAV